MILLSRQINSQPQSAFQLRDEFALYAKCCLVGRNRDFIGRRFFYYPERKTSLRGNVLGCSYQFPIELLTVVDTNAVIPIGSEVTIIYVNDSESSSNAETFTIGIAGSSGSAEFNAYLRFFLDGNAYFRWGGLVDGVTSVQGAAPSSIGSWVLSSGQMGMQIWRNGNLIASNSATPTRTASSDTLRTANGGSRQQAVPLLATFNRQYSKQTNRLLSIKPFSIFRDRQTVIHTPVTASTVPTLSSATYVPGSITSVGFRPRVTAS